MENLNEQEKDQEYIDAFNAGYLITKYAPELKELLNPIKGEGLKFEAFTAGMEQYSLEEQRSRSIDDKTKDNLPDFLKKYDVENKSPIDKNIDRDIEPER